MAGEPGSLWKQRYTHRRGRGLLHRGRQRHQAHPITSGKRVNLIIWMRSSSVRNRQCPMCGEEPSLVTCDGYGDDLQIND
ncbi:2-oxoglutarate and iron-dependent oxygenase domain-containing protein 2 [Geodia barretti]|uniref:2-oxoglutarate and iron-dependent oxygenase domain-containing protein 2 n=1 Tax=Geodia barretti TaxID=519541 RepID=A0AA35W0X6_GEOBA|nr:2-oxoglutarate and iron-dependent oxygenase domain-containing protein 2 [Geodia barretti]